MCLLLSVQQQQEPVAREDALGLRREGSETRLLESLAVRPGTTKSRDALRDILCEDQVMLHERAVDSHIKRLRKKFRSVDEEFNEIESIYGIGYRFSDTRRNQ